MAGVEMTTPGGSGSRGGAPDPAGKSSMVAHLAEQMASDEKEKAAAKRGKPLWKILMSGPTHYELERWARRNMNLVVGATVFLMFATVCLLFYIIFLRHLTEEFREAAEQHWEDEKANTGLPKEINEILKNLGEAPPGTKRVVRIRVRFKPTDAPEDDNDMAPPLPGQEDDQEQQHQEHMKQLFNADPFMHSLLPHAINNVEGKQMLHTQPHEDDADPFTQMLNNGDPDHPPGVRRIVIRRILHHGDEADDGHEHEKVTKVMRIKTRGDALSSLFPMLPMAALMSNPDFVNSLGKNHDDYDENGNLKTTSTPDKERVVKKILVISADRLEPVDQAKLITKLKTEFPAATDIDFKHFSTPQAFIDAKGSIGHRYDRIHDLGVLPKVFNPHEEHPEGDDSHLDGHDTKGLMGNFFNAINDVLGDGGASYNAVNGLPQEVVEKASEGLGDSNPLALVKSTGMGGGATVNTFRKRIEL